MSKFVSALCVFINCLFLILQSDGQTVNDTYLPTVLWHGMGDSCCNPFSMGRIQGLIEDRLPGIYTYSIRIGNSTLQDIENGFLGNSNDHIEEACDKIAADPLLAGGFNAIGFSQGSQFLRAVSQRCPDPPINNLISLGGQQEGVYGFPNCPEEQDFCNDLRKLLSLGAYIPAIQDILVQAQYWHDGLNEEAYRNGSIFIADINNEVEINEDYRTNLMALSNFVMVKFLQDGMVVPQESEWFGFYAPGQDQEVLSLNETQNYAEDRLGLKTMDEAGKLQFLSVDGDHLQFSDEWFLEEIVDVYLS